MNLFRASTYMFRARGWYRTFGVIALFSMVPVLGQLYSFGYANATLRRMVRGKGDTELPEARLGYELLWRGVRVAMLSLLVGVVVGILCAPLYAGQTSDVSVMAPALIQAIQGPTALLVTVISSAISAIVLARLALTDRIGDALNPVSAWHLLRAEPSIWISFAAIGFLITEGPIALVWVLPLHAGWDVAGTVIASTVLWTYGLMINAHLTGQAFDWAQRTARIRAAQVRYRY